ncbi:MAG: hypothetical protein ABS75_21045 [Pelagibacterium sp. SCN 63-23]|nr:MAG: hypothetical protein ABS75_21045 [Pelagibacterium sp. SCN 63-23]
MIDVESIVAEFQGDIARLDRMAANLKSFNEVEYLYRRLDDLVPPEGMALSEVTTEFLLENEALTTALVVAYCSRSPPPSTQSRQMTPRPSIFSGGHNGEVSGRRIGRVAIGRPRGRLDLSSGPCVE